MKLEHVISTLQAHKGDGAWQFIAARSGVSYDTVARIARGAIKNPGALTIEKLGGAIKALNAIKVRPSYADLAKAEAKV